MALRSENVPAIMKISACYLSIMKIWSCCPKNLDRLSWNNLATTYNFFSMTFIYFMHNFCRYNILHFAYLLRAGRSIYFYVTVTFFSLLVIYIYTIFMGDTMYYLYLFIQAVRPVSHYAILMFQLGLMICVNVI